MYCTELRGPERQTGITFMHLAGGQHACRGSYETKRDMGNRERHTYTHKGVLGRAVK